MNLPRVYIATVAIAAAVVVIANGPAIAAPAEGTIRDVGSAEVVNNSYIVLLKPGSSQVDTAVHNLVARYGGTVTHTYSAALRGFAVQTTRSKAKLYAGNPAVASVAPNVVIRLNGTQPNPESWGLDRIDQRNQPLDSSYTYPENSAKGTAYVIDSGIRLTHTDFEGRARYGRDTVQNDDIADDCVGHGTHVAGTIGGKAYGVAKNVDLVAVKVLGCGGGNAATLVAGIDWVTKDAANHKPAVANISLGEVPAAPAVDAAVAASIASGVTYAVSAGNDGVDACEQSPARVPEAITASATRYDDYKPIWSNYGTCVDIFAPGEDIISAAIYSDTASESRTGTSMASPHVAGAAALILAANPTYTPQQVRDTLVGNATPGKVISPEGSPNLLLYVGSGGI